MREQAHPHTHEHTTSHKGGKSHTLEKCIISHRTQCRPDNSTFILLWADSGGSQSACLPATKGSFPELPQEWGCWGLAAGQALPPRRWGSNLQKSLMMPLWATTHHVPLFPAGQGPSRFHSLACRPFSWVWFSRQNEQAGCLD